MSLSKKIASLLLVAALATALPGPVSATENPGDPAIAGPTSLGQAIVGFAINLPSIAQFESATGLQVLDQSAAGAFLVVAADDLADVAPALEFPGVEYVEDDVALSASVVPNDARYGSQYGPAMMGAEAVWGASGYGSSSITVAVLDTGIRRNHEDFEASRMLQGYDYVNNDNNPEDDCSHGTHVSGTIGATTNNGKGVAGMSQVTILPYKVLGPVGGLFSVTCSGSTSDIAQAILDASAAGADIISMSLGGGGSTTLQNAVNSAWNNGVILVGAAGNDGNSNSVDYPAAYSNVIAVAALTSSKGRASYSDMGSQVEIAAPGSNVESTSDCSNTCYESMSGTSMATPHVAGALAYAWACQPSLTAGQLRAHMAQSAEDLGATGRDVETGYGLLRLDDLMTAIGGCGGSSGNNPPVASFIGTPTGTLGLDLDATASADPDGDALSFSWTLGDGNTATGSQPSHTYAAYGTYTVTLTVDDGNGGTDTVSDTFTFTNPNDPDPSTPNLQNGQTEALSIPNSAWVMRKIQVPAGASDFDVDMTGPGCGTFGCSFDADLYVRQAAKPTSSTYDCRPYQTGNNEACSFTNPTPDWYYVGIYGYTGSGTVSLTATYTVPGPVNNAPTANGQASGADLQWNFDGTPSSDPDGDTLTYSWDLGDGTTSTQATLSHTYTFGGTYAVSLTVDDGNGATDTTTFQVVAVDPVDPDPSTPNLSWGTPASISVSAGQWSHHKVYVPYQATNLNVVMDGPSCGVLGCSFDADLYVKQTARPTSSVYDCRPYDTGSDETCTFANPQPGYWYVSVYGYSGSGSVTLEAS